MNKSEIREVSKIAQYRAAGLGPDFVARALSSLIRSTMRSKDAAEIRAFAEAHGLTKHPEFIA
jgi:hypothetical protein